MKKNKRHRGIYMLTAACLLIGAIGGVAAYENRPDQKVPDLQLAVGQSGYDLMAGITYDSEKYTLSVEDTGGLDINRIGKYEVTYALTPLEVPSTEEIPDTTEVPSTEVIPDSTEVPPTETVPGQTPDQTQPPSTETAPGTTPDQTGTPDTDTPDAGTTPDQSGSPGAGTTPDQTGTPDTSTPDAGTTPDKTDAPGTGTTSGTTTDKTDTPASGTVTNDPLGGELEEAQPEDNSGASAKPTDISAVAESIFGTVSAAEITDTQTEGVKYLTRIVWVVAGTDSIFIGYEKEDVKIKANEALYELVLIEDETEQTTDTEPPAQMDQADVTGETGTQTENVDATEETEPQYELVLKKPELLTEGIRVTDSAASLYNGATVTVSDDSELKNAVNIETAEDGTKTIKNINFGTYTIEVTAEDPGSGKKASCTRTVTVEGIRFDAPTLYIGTQNTEYDLTADMSAVDESGNNAEIYVINEDELTAARETVTDAETGEEKTQFIKGTYHVTLGAKHPVTGEEFTIDREIQVVEGYYIYAPALEIMAGSTDYDLTEGVELRSADTDETVADAKIMVEDMSDLERGITEEAEFFGAEENIQTASEEITDEDTINIEGTGVPYEAVMPALAEGEYTVTLAAVNPDDETETITVQRSVRAVPRAETAFRDLEPTMTFQATAYRDRLTDSNVKSGQIAYIGGGLLYLSEYYDQFLGSGSYRYKETFGRGKLLDSEGSKLTFWAGKSYCSQRSWKAQIYAKTYQNNNYDGYILGRVELGDTGLIKKIGAEVKYDFVMDGIRKLEGLTDFSKLPDVNRYYQSFDAIQLPQYEAGKYIPDSSYSNVGSYTAHSVYNGPVFPDSYTGIKLTNDYIKKEKGDWNQFIGSGVRTKQTLKEGGEPDITVEIKSDINLPDISIDDLPDMVENITSQSSILIKGNDKSVYTEGARDVYYPSIMKNMEVPGMQLEWRNLNLKYNSDNIAAKGLNISLLTDNAYLKFKDVVIDDDIETTIKGGYSYANANLAEKQGTFIGENIGGNYKIYNLEDVKLIQNGEKHNTITVGYERYYAGSINPEVTVENLELDINNGTMESYGMRAENTLLLKGYNNTIKLKTMQNVQQLPFKQPTIKARILDVKAADATVLLDKTKDSGSQIEITGEHRSNDRQITVGKSDNVLFQNGDRIAVIKATNGQLDATDFKCKYENRLQYTVNSGLQYVVIKQLTTKSILILADGATDAKPTAQADSYKEAFDWIKANGNGGSYTVKILVPRTYGQEDQTAFQGITTAKASKITLEAANGSSIDDGYMRMRVANELATVELPKDVEVEFKNITVRRSDATGTADEKVTIVKNGGKLNIETNYKTVGDKADIYGGGYDKDCNTASYITVNAGIFENVYGGSGHSTGKTTRNHNADVAIKVGGIAKVTTIDGASADEVEKPTAKNKAVITVSSDLSVTNIYNYSKLDVAANLTVTGNINSVNATGYDGETVLKGGKKLTLSNASGKRQMGSLKLDQSATTDAEFLFAKATGTATAADNEHLVTLTDTKPLTGTNTTNKIVVKYSGSGVKPANNEIVFMLPNAGKNPANVTTQYLKDGFGGKDAQNKDIRIMAIPGKNMIVLNNMSVGVITGTSSKVYPFMTVKDALTSKLAGCGSIELEEQKGRGKNEYRITFFGEGYSISEDDMRAMKDIAAKYPDIKKITWTSKISESGTDLPEANTVYIEGDISLFGKENTFTGIKLEAGGDAAIFAEGKPLTIGTGVEVSGNGATDLYGGSNVKQTSVSTLVINSSGGKGFSTIYGGGKQAQTGDATITMSGGNVGTIYGGGNGAAGKLTGNTTINVSDSGRATDSIYGGGKGAQVTGNTTIDCSGNNSTGEAKAVMKKISGAGTDDAGAAADNVGGTKTISIETTGNQHTGTLVLDELTGFDALNLTNKGGAEIQKAILYVKKRFDSKAVAGTANDRTGTVKLSAVALVLGGTEPGHIGSLNVEKESLLAISRDAGGTTSIPLKLDQQSTTFGADVELKLGIMKNGGSTTKLYNTPGDKVITFTNGVTDTKEHEHYRDALQTLLPVKQVTEGTAVHIAFDVPKTHLSAGWVEYSGAGKPDTANAKASEKTIHVVYDKDNEHEANKGYIAVMPKTAVGTADEEKYTVTDSGFKANGTFAGGTTPDYVKTFDFTQTQTTGAHGKHEATGTVKLNDLDTTVNWYILHTVCEARDASVVLLDLDSPEEGGAVSVELDNTGTNYVYELHLKDHMPEASEQLPSTTLAATGTKMKLDYTANGVKAAYYTIGVLSGDDLTDADTVAVKTKAEIETTADKKGLTKADVSLMVGDGAEEVQGPADAKITVKVPKANVDANKGKALWVYAKDGLNNTIRVAVPLNENIIDVSVPLQVNVIAVKKPDGKAGDRELLAPVCEVQNNGQQQVDAQIVGFENKNTQTAQLDFSNKDKGSNFNADEIALFLKGADTTTFTETNVLGITVQAPIQLGTLSAAGSTGSSAKYTFDAGYNVTDINIPDGYVTGYLSYHFKVKK